MKKLSLFIAIIAVLVCLFAISVSAASTNEFGTVETSDTIDLTGMATDTDVRVVLFDGTEYHTYPSQYIVTSATDITFNFDKINSAFGKSYVNNSVIRIEVPRHVLKIDSGEFNYGKNNNLIEVFFPADSKLQEVAWGAFESNSSLQKINLPKSLQNINNNAFCKCTSLKYISFAEDSTITEIKGEKVFYECNSLEELVFPNSLVKIGNSPFGVCPKLKKIVLGANMETLPGAMSDINGKGTVIYMSAKFYASSVTTEPGANMFHWAGANGKNNNPLYLTFVYTGTKAEAEALQTRFGKVDGLQRLSEATLCSATEYKTLTGLDVGTGSTTGNYLIYGYNPCDAFYNGVHTMENINSCVGKCSVCGIVDKLENPSHSLSYELSLGYVSNGTVKESCGNADCGYTNDISVDQIFECVGYSTKENGTALCVGYTINHDAINEYKKYDASVSIQYGVVASVIEDGEGLDLLTISDGEIVANSNYASVVAPVSTEYAGFDFVLSGFGEKHMDLNIAMCAYVYDGKSISYLSEVSDTEPTIVTLTEILKQEAENDTQQ